MTEQTNFERLTSGIEDDLAARTRESMLRLLLKTSDRTTFGDLVKLTESAKYGEVATSITLQELLDAHVESEGFVPEGTVPEPAEEAPKAPRKRKGKASTGDEVEVSLRTDEERDAFRCKVAAVVQGKCGGSTTSKEVQEKCGGTQSQIRTALRELILDRSIVQNGKARATRYFWRADASEDVMDKFSAFLDELTPEKRAAFESMGDDSEADSADAESTEEDATADLDAMDV